MNFSFLFLILFGVVLLLCAVAGVSLIVWLMRRNTAAQTGGSGSDGNSEGVCGQCGYRVTGLTTFNCPECGGDLRAVGINTAKPRGSGLMWALLIAGGLGAVLLLCICSGLFVARSSTAPAPIMAPIAPARQKSVQTPPIRQPESDPSSEDEATPTENQP